MTASWPFMYMSCLKSTTRDWRWHWHYVRNRFSKHALR